jgi:hypothetical protein
MGAEPIAEDSINRKIFFVSAHIFSGNSEKYFSFAPNPVKMVGPRMKKVLCLHAVEQ